MEIRSFGVSPWELEVAYGYLNPMFDIVQGEEPEDPDFVSVMVIDIPLQFSQEFFDWFGFKRWERIKSLLKEMKRRRGSRKAIRVGIDFAGDPAVSFVIDASDRQLYNNAVEKIDFVLELLPYHLGPGGLPDGTSRITYRYDEPSRRWVFGRALAGGAELVFTGSTWRPA